VLPEEVVQFDLLAAVPSRALIGQQQGCSSVVLGRAATFCKEEESGFENRSRTGLSLLGGNKSS
jgi:hypothetical protein